MFVKNQMIGTSALVNLNEISTSVAAGKHLSLAGAHDLFRSIMESEVPTDLLVEILKAIASKGECVDELVGAATAMREKMIRVAAPPDCIDTCGTGGDGISTFNTSTTAAIIAAAAGATVAKHGNRSTTRVCGSTEVLTLLGIDAEAPPTVVEICIREARIGYLNARNLHPAMKHAAAARQALPGRTIFNLLGPLTNPAGAKRQLLGVPKPELVDLMAEALHRLGAVHVWVVHGADRLCDLSITGESMVAEVTPDGIRRFSVTPETAGLRRASLLSLLVDSPETSSRTVLEILRGNGGATRDHSLLNAGAALVVAGIAKNLEDGIAKAAAAIDSGAAINTLDRWREVAGLARGK